jgi:predicted RNA-binding protein YlqC (UPF0109 family)
MPTIAAQLRRELRVYAVELRKLAYTLPNGIGEHDLLRVSEQMVSAADQDREETSVSLATKDRLAWEERIEQQGRTIDAIRAVIPEWPDTNGTPWEMCAICHAVYDPTTSHSHDDHGRASGSAKQ